ncbi:hypothetical protein SAMN06265373_1081 [Shimia sagamensis]|uniref:Uncharacterized protein n=1 Tax=Shimia sagamensis TaxID=1566352 RepID=A0ABY1PCK7_9RHOB|nr:hypothetical protein SAMN06265373_1081 [Shimia sagamensis]
MKPAMIKPLAVCLLMSACGGSKGVGALRIEPLPATVTSSCTDPRAFLRAGDWEIIAGRLGDELISCNGKRGLAVEAYDGVRHALN